MTEFLINWDVLIVENDPVSNSILKRKIQEILPFAKIKQCRDRECVREHLGTTNVILDCVFLDHHTSELIRNEILLLEKKPIMVSVSGGRVNRNLQYDLIWSKPFPPLDQMRKDLGRVLKNHTHDSSRSDSSRVVHPDH